MERDPLTGFPLPHLSFILRHFIPMAHNCENRQVIQDSLEREWGTFEGVEIEIMYSGSTLEGLNLPTQFSDLLGTKAEREMNSSDLDCMLIMKNKLVCDAGQVSALSSEVGKNEVMEIYTDGVHPGYLQLRVHKSRPMTKSETMFVAKESDDYLYYDPEKVKRMLRDALPGLIEANPQMTFTIQGPAQNIKSTHDMFNQMFLQENDIVFPCFCCPIWPRAAEKWKTRDRLANWPSQDVIQKIVEEGGHVVPVFHSGSKEPDLEWRMSFSRAELTLMQTINRTQRQCYLLLKTLHTQALKEPKALVTYHLKTIFLHMCEAIPQEEWNPDTIGLCLLKMIDRLCTCLKERSLPSYFIPENNLIDRIPPDLCDELVRRVIEIRIDPLKYLFDFNKRYKWFFGPLMVDAKDFYKQVLEDAKTSTSVRGSYEMFLFQGLLNAYQHLTEHGTLMNIIMKSENIQDPVKPGYFLPFDNALDIIEDVVLLHQKVIGEALDISSVVQNFSVRLKEQTDCLIGLLERFLHRYPDNPNRGSILQILGCEYHIKYLRPLEPSAKRLLRDKAKEVFQLCIGSGGSSGELLEYALFLCTVKEEETAIELLRTIVEKDSGNVTAENVSENSYSFAEVGTIDENLQQISNTQRSIALFTYAIAAYLLVKLLPMGTERQDTITRFQAQCVLLQSEFQANKLLQVGNAFVLLGYACELTGNLKDAKDAQEMAIKLLPTNQLPELHIKV